MLRKILGSVFVSIGAGIVTTFFYRYFADLITTGGKHLGTQLGDSIEYLVAAVACIVLGATLWKKWQIPVAEFWVVVGAFCLGVAFRSDGYEAEAHGAFGLAAFVIGYLILKHNTDHHGTIVPDPRLREETLKRIMDAGMPPDAFTLVDADMPLRALGPLALMDAEEPETSESDEATASLTSMMHILEESVRPGGARKLVGQP